LDGVAGEDFFCDISGDLLDSYPADWGKDNDLIGKRQQGKRKGKEKGKRPRDQKIGEKKGVLESGGEGHLA